MAFKKKTILFTQYRATEAIPLDLSLFRKLITAKSNISPEYLWTLKDHASIGGGGCFIMNTKYRFFLSKLIPLTLIPGIKTVLVT